MKPRTKRSTKARLAVAAFAVTSSAYAIASFTVPWYAVGRGGGTSTGGPWSCRSLLGQPCAGGASGGAFSVVSGYLPGVSTPPPCPADVNGDRVINTSDLVLLLARFGLPAPPGSPAAAVDFNADGTVNTPDLVYFLVRFGTTCP